jgi:hypothetical protein
MVRRFFSFGDRSNRSSPPKPDASSPCSVAAIYSSFFELVKPQAGDLQPFNDQGSRRSSAIDAQGAVTRA